MAPTQQPEQPQRKLLIQMSGAPGSGKSTTSRQLRKTLGGVVIDHDILRSPLLESEMMPFHKAAEIAYNLQWKMVDDLIKQGHNTVIIDSPCNYPQAIDQGFSIAAKYDYSYWYVECKVDDLGLLDQRLRNREPMPSQRAALDCPPQGNGLPSVKWTKNPCLPKDETRIINVDSTKGTELVCKQILDKLGVSS